MRICRLGAWSEVAVSGREGGSQAATGSARGALGRSDDQASQGHVEGQPIKPVRKPRKSRARYPPITPEERSAINAANATKHGRYVAQRRLTAQTIEALCERYHQQQHDLDKRGESWQGRYRRPPSEELCEAWREDSDAMTAWVIERYGYRPSRNHLLRRTREDEPWNPDNVTGWVLAPPRTRKDVVRARAKADPVGTMLGKLLDCACDHRAQAACARSTRPCAWAEASRQSAPWLDAPDSE